MTKHEIWRARLLLDKERREKVHELMDTYDKEVFYPRRKELVAECEKLGHSWKFVSTNPLGYPIFSCGVCGTTKIEVDDDQGEKAS